jgi:hypothetical protein
MSRNNILAHETASIDKNTASRLCFSLELCQSVQSFVKPAPLSNCYTKVDEILKTGKGKSVLYYGSFSCCCPTFYL